MDKASDQPHLLVPVTEEIDWNVRPDAEGED
jgi:hypothetical protein